MIESSTGITSSYGNLAAIGDVQVVGLPDFASQRITSRMGYFFAVALAARQSVPITTHHGIDIRHCAREVPCTVCRTSVEVCCGWDGFNMVTYLLHEPEKKPQKDSYCHAEQWPQSPST